MIKRRSSSGSKKRWQTLEATSVEEVWDAVRAAQERYQSEHTSSKTRRCITNLSQRICFYGNIMDILVQNHPEYVALAWGAFKFVFGVSSRCSLGERVLVTDIVRGTGRPLSNMKSWEGQF